jgi:hypothetical protein
VRLALRILESAALLLLAALMLATLARLRSALLLLAALTRFRVLALLLARLGRLLFVLTHRVSPRNFSGIGNEIAPVPVTTTFMRRNCSGACHNFATLRYAKQNI